MEGRLQTRKWQNQQGQDRYITEIKTQQIQFLDKRGSGADQPENEDDLLLRHVVPFLLMRGRPQRTQRQPKELPPLFSRTEVP